MALGRHYFGDRFRPGCVRWGGPLATRNSRATELDILAHDGSAGVRTLVMDRAGHYWPNPQGDKEDWVIHQFGFRNQDLDAADAVWEFLRKALE